METPNSRRPLLVAQSALAAARALVDRVGVLSGRRTGRDRKQRFRIAAGEREEAMSAVRIAIALGWVDPAVAEPADALADRLRAIPWRLCHPRP